MQGDPQRWDDPDGQPHRDDGPAISGADGTLEWYRHGRLHRADGPAYIDANGSEEWWIDGDEITDKVESWIKNNDYPPFSEWDEEHLAMFRRWMRHLSK
jgi:hypothetical protein